VLDQFIPDPQIREHHEILIHAPARLVFDTATTLDIAAIPLIRALFRTRAFLLGAKSEKARPLPLIAGMESIGWRCLERDSLRYAAGAVCQPWNADVVFSPVPPERFASYKEPDHVKIAWCIQAEPVSDTVTRCSTETRAAGTDPAAAKKFRSYWRIFGLGIILIRKILLRELRRAAESAAREVRN
jgi:hypothetical protein